MTGPPPSTDRDALITTLAEQARSGAPEAPEPEPEELLDYLAGRLAPEEAQRTERLLVASPAAARALLDLADLEAAGAGAGEHPAEIATVAGWRDLRERLPSSAPYLPKRLAPLLPAIAASLLAATVGFGSWALRLQSALHRPIANLVSLELPSGSRAASDPVVVVPSGAPLRLVLAPADRCPGYTAEVEGPRSGDRQTVDLERDELGRLSLLLLQPEPGSYGLRLLGCEPRRALEEHRFRVAADGRGGPGG